MLLLAPAAHGIAISPSLASPSVADVGGRSILAASPEECAALLGGSGRAKLVWERLRAGVSPFGEEGGLGKKARAQLGLAFRMPSYTLVSQTASECGTRKLLLELADGAAVEAVVIPSEDRPFSTLCVSSQVGCAQACTFCATGRMGRVRNLSTDEILAQLYEANALVRRTPGLPAIRNVVFMGMGEPLDNAAAVQSALNSMTHAFGFRLSTNHVCVSTVGPSPDAVRATLPSLPARLAWSVHAADEELRRLLVPTSKPHSLVELRDAFADVLAERRDRGLMIECTLIDGVNDGARHAEELVELVAPLPGKTRINLIPYNENDALGPVGRTFRTSPPEKVRAFHRAVMDAGVICTTRTTRGLGEAAACGQLATRRERAR